MTSIDTTCACGKLGLYIPNALETRACQAVDFGENNMQKPDQSCQATSQTSAHEAQSAILSQTTNNE